MLPQPVLFVLETLQNAGYEAYVVGGAVRDLLMHSPTHDWDFTTNATPEQIQTLFPDHFYDNNFGTVGVALEHIFPAMLKAGWSDTEKDQADASWQQQIFEITTYRTDFSYTDHRRPQSVAWGQSLQEDLARRDFTVNALALKHQKHQPPEIIDLYHAQEDLANKLIKAVGTPEERFEEDALRMMRAIRFGAQLGFGIEPYTFSAIQKHSQLIEHISWERIRDELLKTLASPYPADGILMLTSSNLLQYILPEMLAMKNVQQGGHHIHDVWTHSIESLRHCPSTDPLVRLATLLHDIGKPKTVRHQGPRGVTFYGHEVVGARIAKKIGQRLRLSKKQLDKLVTLVRWHMFSYQPEMTDSAIKRFIRNVGIDNINDMLLLRVGDRKGGGSKATSWRLRELQQRIGENLYQPLSLKDLKVDGQDVMQTLNLKPGKKVGQILNQLFEEVMEDSSKNDKDHLLKRIQELA